MRPTGTDSESLGYASRVKGALRRAPHKAHKRRSSADGGRAEHQARAFGQGRADTSSGKRPSSRWRA
jgi:hypothetical protein